MCIRDRVKYQGLFYYYMVLAQALDAAGIETFSIPDPAVVGDHPAMLEINWREALRARLVGMQQEDGSWVNGKNGRWMESMPLLCTCYAMIALEPCR